MWPEALLCARDRVAEVNRVRFIAFAGTSMAIVSHLRNQRRLTMRKMLIATLILGSAVSLGGCARNYTGEGAALGAAVGAGIGAATGGDIATGAAIGGAVGAAGGSQIRKDGDRCYARDRNGNEYRVQC